MKTRILVCVLTFLMLCIADCSCSRRVKIKGADPFFTVPDYHAYNIKKIAVMPLSINLSKECLLLYEQRGLTMPTHDQLAEIFYPMLFETLRNKGYVPMDIAEMVSCLKAVGLESTEAVNKSSPISVSKTLNVDGLFYFTITDFSTMDKMEFLARMVEKHHGLTAWSDHYYKGPAKGKRFVKNAITGIVIVGAYPVGVVASQGVSIAAQKASDSVYQLISSLEKEIRKAVEDSLCSLPDSQKGPNE